MSAAVRKVLACNSRDGETVAGSVVERLAPEVVIARLMRGTASSIRVRRFLMSLTIKRTSALWATRDLLLSLLEDPSSLTALASRSPRD